MLKSLQITGFKSFAKKTDLHSKSKVTAIVGPNGSGKSNVAEAFRFALGEQSMKSMRGKRGEDLIWNGSTEVGRANRASVKLVFDNPPSETDQKNILGVDFSEVTIERAVNRDGVNEYYLNGSLVRLKDIVELLARAHIGASGHHIISQGEADRILSASDKERREMIEDALGLKIHQYKREESERKLLKTEENIKQVESLRREIAPHLKFLKKQVEKVEKAEELRIKLTGFYKEYLKRELNYIENTKNRLQSEKDPLEQKIQSLNKEMEEAKNILNDSKNKDKKSDELIEIENRIKIERESKDRLYRELGQVEGELSANQRNIEKLEAEQKSEENKSIPLKEVEELERAVSFLSEVGAILSKIRDFIRNHRQNTDDRKLGELTSANHSLLETKNSLEDRIKDSEASLFELLAKYQGIKDSIEHEKDTSREAEKTIFRIASEEGEVRNKLNLLQMEERSLRLIEEDWKREVQEAGILLGTAIIGFENIELVAGSHSAEAPREELRKELERMKIRLEELGGAGGAEVLKEYRETTERDEFLAKELEDLSKSADSLQVLIKDLLERIETEFKDGIEKINKSFQEYFSLMFGGGNAELKIEKLKIKRFKNPTDLDEASEINSAELVNILDKTGLEKEKETEIGVEIAVSLPRKRIKSLEMLSGGERALTSIALLFAISQVNPPPFIILDETDAALDEANSKKYGDMIEELAKVSQLILITHNRETMSRAGVIYGVTMGKDGVSRLLSIAFDEAVAVAK